MFAVRPTLTAATQVRSVRANAKAGNWLPGSTSPAYLDGSMAGDYGFDPLSFGSTPANLQRFQEAELIHGRWAMLGVAGSLAVELFGFGNWYDAPLPLLNGGKATYFGNEVPFDLNTLVAVEFLLMAAAESRRADETSAEKRCYPGFDFAGLAKDPKTFESMKLKEVKNGRLAMVAFLGFVSQHAVNGKGPLAALGDHLANPAGVNFATNGISVPGL